jgi:hypothetical protein
MKAANLKKKCEKKRWRNDASNTSIVIYISSLRNSLKEIPETKRIPTRRSKQGRNFGMVVISDVILT